MLSPSYKGQNIWQDPWHSKSKSLHSMEMDWSLWLSTLWKIDRRQLLVLAVVLMPPVHHQTSTILTSVEELSCQAFILLKDQGPSCSYLNITLVHRRFEIAGSGGILFMWPLNTQNALAWPMGFGGIMWWIHVLQQLFLRSHRGSKSGCESPSPNLPFGHFHFFFLIFHFKFKTLNFVLWDTLHLSANL